uniref:NudC domain containing 2 n=1 Tax=Zosterops lateralis melanops TaxID=1220523 RepID=A0A8D2PQY8_ZOSLA
MTSIANSFVHLQVLQVMPVLQCMKIELERGFLQGHVVVGQRGRALNCWKTGKLFDSTVTDEGTWTLEDRQLIRIVLMKTNRDAGNCWTSLLENEYAADPWVQDQMQRKLTLERFQRENPGFDFSGAEISGNYSKGGPDFSSLEK